VRHPGRGCVDHVARIVQGTAGHPLGQASESYDDRGQQAGHVVASASDERGVNQRLRSRIAVQRVQQNLDA
jgi:hypothetical protein